MRDTVNGYKILDFLIKSISYSAVTPVRYSNSTSSKTCAIVMQTSMEATINFLRGFMGSST